MAMEAMSMTSITDRIEAQLDAARRLSQDVLDFTEATA